MNETYSRHITIRIGRGWWPESDPFRCGWPACIPCAGLARDWPLRDRVVTKREAARNRIPAIKLTIRAQCRTLVASFCGLSLLFTFIRTGSASLSSGAHFPIYFAFFVQMLHAERRAGPLWWWAICGVSSAEIVHSAEHCGRQSTASTCFSSWINRWSTKNALTLAGECKSDPIRTCKFVEKVSSAVTSGRLLATATSRSILDKFHSNTHRSIDLETLFEQSFETVTIRSQVGPQNGVKWTWRVPNLTRFNCRWLHLIEPAPKDFR